MAGIAKYLKDVLFVGPAYHQAGLLIAHPVASTIMINLAFVVGIGYTAYKAYNAGWDEGRISATVQAAHNQDKAAKDA